MHLACGLAYSSVLVQARYYQVRGLILVIEDMVKKASGKEILIQRPALLPICELAISSCAVKRKDEPSDEKVYKLVSNVETRYLLRDDMESLVRHSISDIFLSLKHTASWIRCSRA